MNLAFRTNDNLQSDWCQFRQLVCLPQSSQNPIQPRSEGLLCPGIVRRRSAGHKARQPGLFHKVADGKPLTYRFWCVLLSPWVEDGNLLRYQQCRQGYILRNNEVAGDGMCGDVPVSDVGPAVHPDGAHQRVTWRSQQPLVRHQNGLDAQPFSGTEHQLLNISWRCIGINPDSQLDPLPLEVCPTIIGW